MRKRPVGQIVFGVVFILAGLTAYYVGGTLTQNWWTWGQVWPLLLGGGLGITFLLLPPPRHGAPKEPK